MKLMTALTTAFFILASPVYAGALVWMDSFPYEEGIALMQEFQKSHTDVDQITYVGIPAAQKVARIIQEGEIGKTTTDVITGSIAPIKEYRSRGIVVTEPISASSMVSVIVYNTNKVKKEDLPKSMEDLTDPKWTGRIGVWARMADVVGLAPVWGSDRVVKFTERLVALKPVLYKNYAAMNAGISSGEIDIGINSLQQAQQIMAKGAPVDFVVLEPVAIVQTYAAVSAKGENQKNAARFVSWLTSPEGAEAMERITRRGNVNVPTTKAAQLVKGRVVSVEKESDPITLDLETKLSRLIQGR